MSRRWRGYLTPWIRIIVGGTLLAVIWSRVGVNLDQVPWSAGLGLSVLVASGLLVACVVWLWRHSLWAAAVIGLSIVLSVITACLMGFLVPSLLRRLKLDPKIAAGPVALALADIFTLLFYFNIASFMR